jgi:SSS family solute:Na+ symporter
MTTLDYLIIGIPLIIVLFISLSLRRYMNSVADFLAANRCAGRYLICSASGELGAAVMGMVGGMEAFSKTGVSMGFWGNFTTIIFFIFTLFGVVTYRFRQTRCLTFHQFLEVRYSRGLRIFASSMNIFSGMINFGLIPAVGGRFFVYFCGLPDEVHWGGFPIPTFAIVMVCLMAMSLLMAMTGGQISVMVTDCVEGLISGVFYLVVAFFIVFTISLTQMKETLLSGAPGKSYINPFDISDRQDFNGTYIILGLIFNLYIYRGSAWLQGFNAAAKTAHEGVMAAILGSWRGFAAGAMGFLISIGAFTILNHPAFAAQQAAVHEGLKNIHPMQLQTEMSMPLALGLLLAPGIKGAFCAICLFGVLSSQGQQLHGYGSTLLQDAILPWMKNPLSPKAHLLALRMSMLGVALFVCTFSLLYKPVEYLTMMVSLIGAIYLGGMGAIVWGGLYWKRGTTAGAMTAMIVGTSLAIIFNVLQQFWVGLQPLFVHMAGSGPWGIYLAAHPEKCPVNGQWFSTIAAMCALVSYIIASLLTCKKNFDLDQMLHRGRYAIKSEDDTREPMKKGFAWSKLIGINEDFTVGDKVLSFATFLWVLAWKVVALGILLWWLFYGKLSDAWWFQYTVVTSLWIPLVLGIISVIWFTIGTTLDILDLLRTLKLERPNDRDDGTVRNHHNLGEPK